MRLALFHNIAGLGPKRAVHQLARGLLRRGHTLEAFCPDTANERFLPLEALGVPVRVYPWPKPSRPPELRPYLLDTATRAASQRRDQRAGAEASRRVAADLDVRGYDAVWVDGCLFTETPVLPLFLKTPALVYCHEPKCDWFERPLSDLQPSGRGVRGWYTASAEWWLARQRQSLIDAVRRSVARAARVVTNSEYTRAYLARVYGVSAHVSYLGVDTDLFRPGAWPRERSALMVGKIRARTGWDRLELLRSALERFEPARRPSLRLVASDCDPATARQAEADARRRGVALTILTHLDDRELAHAYARAGVVACTAQGEPFGLVAIEAMACGTPVVAVREGGLPESVEHGRTGLLVEPTAEGLARGLADVLDNPVWQAAMGRAAVEAVAERWTWHSAAERFERHLLEIRGHQTDCRAAMSMASPDVEARA
jgi:glycosyltransferase involved in cell wall biosynthesis